MMPWTDTERPLAERVETLLAEMTLDEKLAQLASVWVGAELSSGDVAPLAEAFEDPAPWPRASAHGMGHITRPLGTSPVDPAEGARKLAELQADLVARTRLKIPAIAHEECLTGFTTYGATVFPTPLGLAATFDPALVERMTVAIGESMRATGAHQGLSPVMDVVRDYRWGRVEETFGEDPYLVGMMGAAYVRGLESTGLVATLKHFAGYSASVAARNHAPVMMGPRVLRDVMLVPFEMAIREGGARSVMNSYTEIDGLPVAADAGLLTGILRDEWGFEGTVVSDYWSVVFLLNMHRVASTPAEAGALSLAAGIDVELPHVRCYGEPLAAAVRSGVVPEALVDRAARRVLVQKGELGLLDPGWTSTVPEGSLDIDPPEHRAIARELADRSIVLLANDGTLPLRSGQLALVGPCAADPLPFLGCYSYPNHGVMAHHPDMPIGIEVPTLLDALPHAIYAQGCDVQDDDPTRLPAAVEAAGAAELCVVAVGDHPGLFGRGTSGEGCDAEDVALPGIQDELVEAVLETGTPVVLVVVSGRPYALGRYVDRVAAIVQAFLPGEEGAAAIAGVLTGDVMPTGRLPVQVPAHPGAQPSTYLHPPLGGTSGGVSNIDTDPAFAFGHGLSYTTFEYGAFGLSSTEIGTDGSVDISCVVRNSGERAGAEVVQLYLSDPVAPVTRPVTWLAGFLRVDLEPGEAARVTFTLHADRTAFTGVDLRRIVQAGEIGVAIGASAADIRGRLTLQLVGEEREVGHNRVLTTPAVRSPA
ncbi:glycoside hydrolase family 3 N-terminal domain-containing protein [Solirubrobacter soli]|uniref:glycoside hydrolase family 3 N-terminal domain-containing protein n=1 Tax=Solirubrobacter soli TaxID=363832 RepID=UPI00041A2D2A|nr:glycoside hydrolase family 3 N-terminal domain-containing protein [Solirubrobacter soli]